MNRICGFKSVKAQASANTTPSPRRITVKDLYTTPGANLCLRTTASLLPRRVEITVTSSTTRVVVFMPPAVEPGQPPMNISAMESTFVKLPWAPMSTEAKPAVLVFTD